MDNAVNAINSLLAKGPATDQPEGEKATNNPSDSSAPTSTDGALDKTVDSEVAEVAPAVEHTHVKKQHETREQTFVEKEKHQDHYHTTIQPVKDSEVLPEKHEHIQETKNRSIDHDDGTAKPKAEADRAGFESTSEQSNFESKTQEPTQVEEHVHHHLHETVQPVIEKEVIDPSITHKRVDVKEKVQEPSKYHGVTTNSAVSAEEFEKKLQE
ncbi:hypothetical protein D0Z07_2350 [Hyphodiscus hymeniophilus]|uniref:Allergen n=1 Tax=Hyphodiscus hymeniophilus TaxID=353542 RepID=A0A9P6VMG6_9HELO|nr:hypothetical protein D0Z07_2350 [Hyphodiscus hymeniophilus]